MVKNFKKIMACLLAFAVIFTCIGSALATVSAETAIVTNANGKATDVGIWYTPYNCSEFFANRFADPDSMPVGYKALLPDGTYGVPFAGNEDIIDFYIEQMAKVGIDFVMFDCTNGGLTEDVSYGWGEGADGNCWNVAYAKLFAEHLSEWNDTHAWKIRYAVSVGTYKKIRGYENLMNQGMPFADVANYQAQGVIDLFLNDEVVGDDYYVFDGKPLLTLFDYDGQPLEDDDLLDCAANPETALGKFTVRYSGTGEAGAYSWCNNSNNGAAVYDEEVVTVCPGHSHASGVINDSRRNGLTYQENWETVLNAAATPRVVMISSFNDYMENTAVFVTDTSDAVYANGEETWDNPYQYWDMTVDYIEQLRTKDGDSTEIDLGYENYAKTAEVSSNASLFWPEGLAWNQMVNINDGNRASRVILSAPSSNIANIDFTFATAKKVNTVNFVAEADEGQYTPKHFAVEANINGKWVRVAELHNITLEKREILSFYFDAVTTNAIRVRVNITGQENEGATSLGEIEIYNNPTVTAADYTGINDATNGGDFPAYPGVKSENYAEGAVITDGDWNAHLAAGPSCLVDGLVDGSRSASQIGGSKNPWYDIAFDGTYTINTVNLVWDILQNYTRTDFAVDVMLADGSYVRVAEVHLAEPIAWVAGAGTATAVTFEEIEAAGIRVWFVGSAGEMVSLTEIQAYHDDSVVSYTGITVPADSEKAIKGISSTDFAKAANGATISTSMTNSSPSGDINSAIDDNITNWGRTLYYWSGAKADYYQINFAAVSPINTVEFYVDLMENYQSKDLALDVQLADGSWKRVAEIHYTDDAPWASDWSGYVNKHNYREFTFATEFATAIRIWAGYTNRTGALYSLSEVSAYNYSGKISGYTGIPTGLTTAQQIANNVALGGTYSDSFATHHAAGPSCLVDGMVDGSRSASDFGTAQCAYYQIMFKGGVSKINTVNLVWDILENYTKKDFAVEVVTAAGTRVLVAEVHLAENPAWTANVATTTSITFEDIEAAGIRVWFNKAGGGLVSLTEIEAYGYSGITEYTGINKDVDESLSIPTAPAADAGVIVSSNVALGQKVSTTNTNWSLFGAKYPASRLTDGIHGAGDDKISAIANYVNGEASFTVKFDKAYTINKVVTLLSAHEAEDTHRPDEYVIDVETKDGWVRVAVKAATFSNGHLSDTFYFEAIEALAVRVTGNTKATGGENFRLNEIEAYYDSSITEDLYTGFASSLDAAYTAGIQGDVDGNSWVNAVDLAYALNWYTRARERVEGNAAIMDTNRDGKYDIRDYIYLVEVIATRDYTLMD